MKNPFVHVELQTGDTEKAKKFYGGLLGWTLRDVPEWGYTMIEVGEGTGGGIAKSPEPDTPSQWVAFIQVDDAQASTKKVTELGGKVLKEVSEIPSIDWFSVIADPTGAKVGLFQPFPSEQGKAGNV